MKSKIINSNEAGQRMDKFLKKYMPYATTSFFYKMLRKKNITLNGLKASGNEILSVNDEIKFFFSDETFDKFRFNGSGDNTSKKISSETKKTAEYIKCFKSLSGIKVVFENSQIAILNKPSGILSQKSVPQDMSINEWFIGYLLDTKQLSENELETFHPSICNRLDRNTSGMIICGKTLYATQFMSEMIKKRSLRKFYLAKVRGKLEGSKHLTGYLIKDDKSNSVKIFDKKIDGSDYIETKYQVISYDKENNQSLVEVELITGKTHQIRAHLASIGYPLVGDKKYSGIGQKNGQMLHAYKLVFPKINDEKFADMSEKTIICNPEWAKFT